MEYPVAPGTGSHTTVVRAGVPVTVTPVGAGPGDVPDGATGAAWGATAVRVGGG